MRVQRRVQFGCRRNPLTSILSPCRGEAGGPRYQEDVRRDWEASVFLLLFREIKARQRPAFQSNKSDHRSPRSFSLSGQIQRLVLRMKKTSLFLIGSTMLVGSVTSAPPNHGFPNEALENYDIRSDRTKDGAATLAAYRAKATASTNIQTLTAAQLFALGRSGPAIARPRSAGRR